MKTLYLIPARGGSKGIPHKNIRPLCGLPLIGYSINVAREFADDRDICLSTDDPEIAETARKWDSTCRSCAPTVSPPTRAAHTR